MVFDVLCRREICFCFYVFISLFNIVLLQLLVCLLLYFLLLLLLFCLSSTPDEDDGSKTLVFLIVLYVSSYRSVHFSRPVLFCEPHQQLFTHSLFYVCSQRGDIRTGEERKKKRKKKKKRKEALYSLTHRTMNNQFNNRIIIQNTSYVVRSIKIVHFSEITLW